ncbi:hypothetical protein COY95_04185, partial [Candidatus Woesearchaeota archaeon CG_4_10_14_0_8_um_filter_47_5]
MKKKNIIILSILVFVFILLLSHRFLYKDSDFSNAIKCKMTGGGWLDRGTDEECNPLDWNECVNNTYCM